MYIPTTYTGVNRMALWLQPLITHWKKMLATYVQVVTCAFVVCMIAIHVSSPVPSRKPIF